MTHTLSSTAQRSYWLGRYLERAENTARLVNVNAGLLYDLPKRLPLGWQPLVAITGSQPEFYENYDEPSEKNICRFLINDLRNSGSLLSTLEAARENVRTLRGIVPRQTVEYVNEMVLFAKEHLTEPLSRSRRTEALIEIPKFTQRIEGFMSANMLHNAYWRFFRLGNYIERTDMTSRIMDVGTDNLLASASNLEPFADIQWRSVLLSLDAVQSYNSEMQEPIQQESVLNFLLHNERLPRSLAYGINSIRQSLRGLPRHEAALRIANRIRRKLNSAVLTDAAAARAFLDEIQIDLAQLDRRIYQAYFDALTEPMRAGKPERQNQSQEGKGS